jgi:tRNA(fMet)-specific endonuclease VapC
MLVLDTNHIQEISRGTVVGAKLLQRLAASGEENATTVISVDETLRGWLAEIRVRQDVVEQISPYLRLYRAMEFYASWLVLLWDEDAAERFRSLRAAGIRIGTQDLKIAAIVLAHVATLLTRNSKDFAQVPGLKFANWLDH